MSDRTNVVCRIADQLTMDITSKPMTLAQRILDYLLKSTLARECLRRLIHEKDVAEFTCELVNKQHNTLHHIEEALQRVDAIRSILGDHKDMAAAMPNGMEAHDVALLSSASSDLYEVLHHLTTAEKR